MMKKYSLSRLRSNLASSSCSKHTNQSRQQLLAKLQLLKQTTKAQAPIIFLATHQSQPALSVFCLYIDLL